jgi:uncharacterized protein (TIGR00369 family)
MDSQELSDDALATGARQGPFWDFVAGRAPRGTAPAAELLGWKLLAIDPAAGTIGVQFDVKAEFLNPHGNVQGGFLAAMLDETMGPALAAMLEPGSVAPTVELKVNFVAPTSADVLIGEGRVVYKGATICFLEGRLQTPNGQLVATASATSRVVRAK